MQAAAEKPPSLSQPPEIITTAPTLEFPAPQKKPSRLHLAGRMRKTGEALRTDPDQGRASSATGRKSFGDWLGFRSGRHTSEVSSAWHGPMTPATSGSNGSKNNSLQIVRESVVLPERLQDDTPSKYLERLLGVVSRSVIAASLSKGTDAFSQSVLRSYMRGFMFFEDPMDMAIRKLLMEAELPKETQQIDRCLQAFANRYDECNPGIYASPEQAYFIAFSLLILHTDAFNKNNKHKMQKADYLKNTRGEGIFSEILEVFYDNITYTPFIHVEDDLDINGERIIPTKAKKRSLFPGAMPDPARRVAKEPIDPYTLIIDKKLDILRPDLKDVMPLEDHYSYLGTVKSLDMGELQKTFFKTGVLQIVSARSRPDAFMTEKTATNPDEAHPGIVDIKITKVGLLWRKGAKKKRARSPWQEWGAILTGAQLYFFRNTAWVKNLMHQYDEHVRRGHDGDPCYFRPPLEQFKPDALMSTDGAVALLDSTYTRHKNAFLYVRHGGCEEVLLAENQAEMNDWLAKLNYAAAFRTSGVRMRGVVGGQLDGQNRRAIRRLDNDKTQSIHTPTGDVVVTRSRVDHQMVQDILAARRDIMLQKVADANRKLEQAEKKLDSQLRNARHLQLLAPIQPKTREHMLLSAAKMAAQLKWTRVEMWRLKCHRDILLLDLEEERQQSGLARPLDTAHPAMSSPDKGRTHDEAADGASASVPASPNATVRLSETKRSAGTTAKADGDSSLVDGLPTSPTSSPSPVFSQASNAWDLAHVTLDGSHVRRFSASSTGSSEASATDTLPERRMGSAGASPDQPHADDGSAEVDADERDFLEQAGLLPSLSARSDVSKAVSGVEADHGRADHGGLQRRGTGERRRHSSRSGERNSKVRRSLQRTLREGAGIHLAGHRSSRKGKELAGSHVGGSGDADEGDKTPADMLTRGSGSFVVHGKKASVITFGQEFQGIVTQPDERLRQRKASLSHGAVMASHLRKELMEEAGAPPRATAGSRPSTAISDGDASSSATVPDFRAVVMTADRNREGRESAASASSATARSFGELRRKYSTAQQHRHAKANTTAALCNGSLAVPTSDEDSDAAGSFSDAGHTPLPVVGGVGVGVGGDGDGDGDGEGGAMITDVDQHCAAEDGAMPRQPRGREGDGDGGEGRVAVESLPSPPRQQGVAA
ncbi:hypothetical protein P8C59_006631 [Phyllachora maydis]|uniref:Guanyl-nucleotide exchange factor n=1 Tax=Phyllachora maydis TaxID=1825666 RepID=A0AAD9I7W5_9PEZI|nr:hypothetical protein P8C59_006631 [Phyllachora maydis]